MNKFSVKNRDQAKNKLAIKGCRKMSILKTASSPMTLDQVYLVPDETAPKDTWLGYKDVCLTCCSIVGTEGAIVQRHMFGVFNNWRKCKALNEVPEDVSRP